MAAGAFLCAAVGCETTRPEGGPNLNPPIKSTGPGNQVLNSSRSPGYNSLAGHQAPVNSFPDSPMNNSSALLNRSNNQMQGMQLPQSNMSTNNSTPYGRQTMPAGNIVMPSQQLPPEYAPNNYSQVNQGQMIPPPQKMPQQLLQPVDPQSPLPEEQGPAMPISSQGLPTSRNDLKDLKIPDPPANAREVTNLNGPSLMPATQNAGLPTLESVPNLDKESKVNVLAEYHPGAKGTSESPVVVTTPGNQQPVVEAPITVFPLK